MMHKYIHPLFTKGPAMLDTLLKTPHVNVLAK